MTRQFCNGVGAVAKVRLFYRRKICYWLIVSVMILMTLNPSLQVIAKESVSDDLTVYTDAGESLELYARSAVLMHLRLHTITQSDNHIKVVVLHFSLNLTRTFYL